MTRDTAFEPPTGDRLAVGLGWFSIALGVAELAAPHSVARFIGVTPTEKALTTLRSYGAREVGNGLAILAQPHRAAWLWSRVAGDALDLATLAGAMNKPDTDGRRATFAAVSVLAVTALDVMCARQLGARDRAELYSDRGVARHRAASHRKRNTQRVRVNEVVTINQPLERVEERWSQLDSMPDTLKSLTRSSSGGDERTIVEFRHAPGGRGTEVRVEVEYSPRGGAVGAALAKLFGGDPTGQIRHDLRRFKQIVETGEIVLSDGPSLWRPGRPAESVEEVRHAAGVGV